MPPGLEVMPERLLDAAENRRRAFLELVLDEVDQIGDVVLAGAINIGQV